MQETRGYTAFFNSNGPLRGGKRDLYEGGIRIPFIARWKGKVQAGTTSSHISYFTDFLATACDIAGVETPENTDGISYLPELTGKPQTAHEFIYFEFYGPKNSQAVRQGKWKAVKNNVFADTAAQWELYDLSVDLAEQNNIAEQYPEKVAELDAFAKKSHKVDTNWPLFASENVN